MKDGISVSRDKLLSIGTCFGKFTKTLKFRLQITCLDLLSQFAKYKVFGTRNRLGIIPRNRLGIPTHITNRYG
jgi:ribosome biogenesis protein Nip4